MSKFTGMKYIHRLFHKRRVNPDYNKATIQVGDEKPEDSPVNGPQLFEQSICFHWDDADGTMNLRVKQEDGTVEDYPIEIQDMAEFVFTMHGLLHPRLNAAPAVPQS